MEGSFDVNNANRKILSSMQADKSYLGVLTLNHNMWIYSHD